MIALRGRPTRRHIAEPLERRVWMLCDPAHGLAPIDGQACLLAPGDEAPVGFGLYVMQPGAQGAPELSPAIELPLELGYLGNGDAISIASDGSVIRVVWRASSMQNSVLLTERCDNFCLMCSQPPKRRDDRWLLDDAFELVRLLPPDTQQFGITGGEPTVYGQGLIDLLALCTERIPEAGIHVLSNGRRFSDSGYAAAWASVENKELMVGIPIYGPEPALHDYVVQAAGAFNETVTGIVNLASLEQRIEVRVVIHQQTAPVLVEIAEFIARNLPFVDQVALMGLEMMGFARANADILWLDPVEYAPALTEAALLLDAAGIRTMIYNHQLCLIERSAWPFAVKSISDWKNEYHDECSHCAVADQCGGFFASATYRLSPSIKAVMP